MAVDVPTPYRATARPPQLCSAKQNPWMRTFAATARQRHLSVDAKAGWFNPQRDRSDRAHDLDLRPAVNFGLRNDRCVQTDTVDDRSNVGPDAPAGQEHRPVSGLNRGVHHATQPGQEFLQLVLWQHKLAIIGRPDK